MSTNRARVCGWLAVQLAAGLLQAASVFALLPVLGHLDVGDGQGSAATTASRLLSWLGLHSLSGALLGYAVLVTAAAVLSGWASVMVAQVRIDVVDRVRGQLFDALSAAPWRDVARLRHAELISGVSVDVMTVGNGATAVLTAVGSVLVVVLQLAAALCVTPVMTAAALAALAGAGCLLWPSVRRSRLLGARMVAGNRAVLSVITEYLTAIKPTKAQGESAQHGRRYRQAVTESRRAQLAAARAQARAGVIQAVAVVVLLVGVVVFAVHVVRVPPAEVLVIVLVLGRLAPQVAAVQRSALQAVQAGPAHSRLVEDCAALGTEQVAPAPSDLPSPPLCGDVSLEAVSLSYGSGRPALREVSVTIPARTLCVVVGPSGAGKTTLCDVVVGLLRPDSGTVRVGGVVLDEVSIPQWRQRIALVPQEPVLLDMSVRDNLRWSAPGATDAELWDALEVAAARRVVEGMPNGLESRVGHRGGLLSGGERQRLALARALLRRPELLVLDEATSGVDEDSEALIVDGLTALRGRVTVLAIAHRGGLRAAADHVVTLREGEVLGPCER